MSAALLLLLVACGDEAGKQASGGDKELSNGASEMQGGAGMHAAQGGTGANVMRENAGGTGASGNKDKPNGGPSMDDTTDFVSADTRSASASAMNGVRSPSVGAAASGVSTGAAGAAAAAPSVPATTTPGMPGDAGARSVERGDIYSVLPDQRLLNLNSYRGVQIIDVRDPSKPALEGRFAVAGQPLEMYVVGDRAFVLLNNWQGYYGSRDDVKVRGAQGGLVLSVDIHDRAHPSLIDQAEVKGSILTSRLTQGNGQAALYVAATFYEQTTQSIIKSFDVSSGKLSAKSELDLGGYVQDVQATTELMLVASNDYSAPQQHSTVTVIDISRADGMMTRGGTVNALGMVQNKFNMDAYKGVLRVVSGASWSGVQENHLQTFSLSNLQKPTPIADCKLGQRDQNNTGTESLYATVFIENRAFFVTYYRRDPFHAFSIDDAGQCAEHTQFIVSGWNDFLRPALNDTRLIGIGRNDENFANKLSVSLYDAVNLDNRSPLQARADIDLAGSYSEANWDDRGFSVIEDAVSVKASDGTTETGLVLLPFSGYDPTTGDNISRVQLFTFSNHTLTKRGSMDHGTPVRRSFEIEADTTANLSDQTLSLFDTHNPDAPAALSRLDVAPNYSHVFVYGDHVARLRENMLNYYPASMNQTPRQPPKNSVQILSSKSDPDGSQVLASFDVTAGARLTQVGSLLVSAASETTYDMTGQNPKTHTKLQVFDLSDPEKPRARGSLETDRIDPYYGGGVFYPMGGVTAPPGIGVAAAASTPAGCFNCGYPGITGPMGYVAGDAIVFPHVEQQQKSEGWVTQCTEYASNGSCYFDADNNVICGSKFYSGSITCTTPQHGVKECTGQFYLCDQQGHCDPVDPPENNNRSCSTFEQFRYWQSYAFDTLDLRNADAPKLIDRVSLPTDEETTSLISAGKTLYYNFQKPYQMPNDARRYVKHYVRLIGFDDPSKPERGDPINIPGDVIAADGDTLFTRDFVWNTNNDARTLVARLGLSGGAAHLEAKLVFEDRQVSAVKLDGKDHVLVSSDAIYVAPVTPWGGAAGASAVGSPSAPTSKLTILNAADLTTVGEADIDSWASFQDAAGGRALYQVSGGLLVIDVQDPQKPKAQAYFPTLAWPSEFVFDGETILFAGGQYGVYKLDASVNNLLVQ